MKLSEIAKLLELNLSCDDIEIVALNTLKDANSSEVSFVSNAKYVNDISSTKAAAVILTANLKDKLPDGCIALVVDEPYLSMAKLSKFFSPTIEEKNAAKAIIGEGSDISDKAEIAKGAIIGKNCTILAHAYIGANVRVGDNTIIYPSVTIYRDCVIGSNCIIHASATVGGDGFGFATTKMGQHVKIYQNGNVVVGNNVEIGSSTTIDRAVFGSTIIKEGVHLDNLVQIGHNCIIGEYSVLVAQSGVAGSTELGRNVVMGGQSASAGHLTIAPFTMLASRAGVTKSIKEPNKTYAGFPLMEHRLWLKLQGKIARLLKQ